MSNSASSPTEMPLVPPGECTPTPVPVEVLPGHWEDSTEGKAFHSQVRQKQLAALEQQMLRAQGEVAAASRAAESRSSVPAGGLSSQRDQPPPARGSVHAAAVAFFEQRREDLEKHLAALMRETAAANGVAAARFREAQEAQSAGEAALLRANDLHAQVQKVKEDLRMVGQEAELPCRSLGSK